MNQRGKEVLMKAVINGTLRDVQNASKKHTLIFDEGYFNYKLLQAALHRKHVNIRNFLIDKIGCRVPLHLAMELNERYIITKLLSKGALVFDKDENGEIPLLTGFKNKNYEAVHALLTHCKPNCKPDDKDFILHFHIACVTNHTNAAVYYLKCGVDPNIPLNLDSEEYSGLNPVQYAVEKSYYLLFQQLVRHGGNLSIQNAKGLTPLHIIYYTSSTETRKNEIKRAFENGNIFKFVNSVDSNGVSHFHLCCMLNKPDFVQVYIDNEANVNSSISSNCTVNPGFTPLHFAVVNGCEKVVELLLKNGADCNIKDKEGKTPLHLACKISGYWKTHIVKMLLDNKAIPTITDTQACTPLHTEFYYANRENKIIFDMLSSKMPGKINFTDNEGLSHFHIACATNDINRVKDFLDSGVEVNSCVSSGLYSGYTALHFAVLHNQKDVVELLLENNAQVNIKTKEFQITPLHLACEFNYAKFCGNYLNQKLDNFQSFPIDSDSSTNRRNQLDIISLLLSYGAHVNAKDHQGITPLLHTCMIDRNYCKLNWYCTFYLSTSEADFNKEISTRIKKIVKMLLSNKAKVNVHSNRQESILHVISKYSSLKITKKIIKLILSKSTDIDALDDAGLTPLHVAVKAKNKRIVRILLKHNANVNIKCKNSKIPLHSLFSTDRFESRKFGTQSVEREIFCALLENGSDVNITVSKENRILLHAAISYQNDFIIDQLLNYGADINMEDSFGNSCISQLFEWRNEDSDYWPEYDLARVFQIVYIHIQKLLALDLHVSEKIQRDCSQLYPHHRDVFLLLTDNRYINLDNIFPDCTEELKKMKSIKINNCTSLHSILLKDPQELSKYVRNKNLIKIVKAKYLNEDFPLYGNFLKVQFRRGLIRSDLLHCAKVSLRNITNIDLPDFCYDPILKNLKNEDLVNLKIAASSKRSFKRKLNDTHLNETEPLSNCKKQRKIED